MAMKIEELIEAMVEARLRKIKIDEELAALTQQAKALERKQPAMARMNELAKHMVDRSIAEVKQ